MFWLIPVAGAIAGAVCAAVGIVGAARALGGLERTLDRLRAQRPEWSSQRLALALALGRIERDADAAVQLGARARTALDRIRAALGALHLREAAIALRVAGFALRALASLR